MIANAASNPRARATAGTTMRVIRACRRSAASAARRMFRRSRTSRPSAAISATMCSRFFTVASSVAWTRAALGEIVRPSSAVSF